MTNIALKKRNLTLVNTFAASEPTSLYRMHTTKLTTEYATRRKYIKVCKEIKIQEPVNLLIYKGIKCKNASKCSGHPIGI